MFTLQSQVGSCNTWKACCAVNKQNSSWTHFKWRQRSHVKRVTFSTFSHHLKWPADLRLLVWPETVVKIYRSRYDVYVYSLIFVNRLRYQTISYIPYIGMTWVQRPYLLDFMATFQMSWPVFAIWKLSVLHNLCSIGCATASHYSRAGKLRILDFTRCLVLQTEPASNGMILWMKLTVQSVNVDILCREQGYELGSASEAALGLSGHTHSKRPDRLLSANQLEEFCICPITQCLMNDPVIAKVSLWMLKFQWLGRCFLNSYWD